MKDATKKKSHTLIKFLLKSLRNASEIKKDIKSAFFYGGVHGFQCGEEDGKILWIFK